MEIVESYLKSKMGKDDGGEDRLVLGPRFFGVVDGATDKSGLNWGTQKVPRKGGYVLANIVKEVLESDYISDKNYAEILDIINEKIHLAAKSVDIDLSNESNRSDVGFAVYDAKENKMVYIHDCNFAFIGKDGDFTAHYNEKPLDSLTGSIRSAVANWYSQNGVDPFANGDLARKAIQPGLDKQLSIQNQGFESDEEWFFGVPKKLVAYKTINGFPTTLDTHSVPQNTSEIVLSSDGFNVLKPTLDETLSVLQNQMKKDPHCIDELKSTKGLVEGNISFDDASYLRVRLS